MKKRIIAIVVLAVTIIALIVAAVVALKWAWDNNFGGIRDKTQAAMYAVKTKIESIKSTFENVKKIEVKKGKKCLKVIQKNLL